MKNILSMVWVWGWYLRDSLQDNSSSCWPTESVFFTVTKRGSFLKLKSWKRYFKPFKHRLDMKYWKVKACSWQGVRSGCNRWLIEMIVDFIFADEISQRHCRRRGKLDHECSLYGLCMERCMYELSDWIQDTLYFGKPFAFGLWGKV